MYMNKRFFTSALLIALATSSLFAQLTATEKKEVVDQLSKEMIARYVVKVYL